MVFWVYLLKQVIEVCFEVVMEIMCSAGDICMVVGVDCCAWRKGKERKGKGGSLSYRWPRCVVQFTRIRQDEGNNDNFLGYRQVC